MTSRNKATYASPFPSAFVLSWRSSRGKDTSLHTFFLVLVSYDSSVDAMQHSV